MPTKSGRLLSIARIRVRPDWRIGPEKHEYHQWLIVGRGRSFVRINGVEHEATAGQCFFFARGVTHAERTDPDRPHESYGACFACDGLSPSLPVRVADSNGRMRILARWLTAEWGSHAADAAPLRQHYFAALLTEWLRLTREREDPMVARVRQHIRTNLGRPLGLDDLARVAGLSRYHFSRLYREKAGRTVSDDLRALRLEHAQNLILNTDMPIKDVASSCGLTDQQYLTRLFRKTLNATPGELRRSRPMGAG